MKSLKAISLLCLLSYLPIYAEEVTEELPITEEVAVEEPIESVTTEEIQVLQEENSVKESTNEKTIQELIDEVKNAPDKEKRVLMNQIKTQLKTMQQESREKAMLEIKKSFDNKEMGIKKQHQSHEADKHENHQPKFRHLQRGIHDNSEPKHGRGSGHK